MLLKGKVALITGASRGIGAATAILFAREGARVAINYVHSKEAAEHVAQIIRDNGGEAEPFCADVTKQEEVDKMVAEVSEKFGSPDLLVVNAGLHFKVGPFYEFTWEDFDHKYVGEMKAAFFITRAIIPSMLQKGAGSIVFVSSGLSKRPGEGMIIHSASKAALNAFSRSLAIEYGEKGIRINTVAPGLTDTDATNWLPEERKKIMSKLTPLKRIAQPEDIAGAILMLSSDHAGFITGGYLPVDGGITML
ncbi:MAG: SDR family NAD(P)-dependent oxidoreductase [Chloroflexota bacterium]